MSGVKYRLEVKQEWCEYGSLRSAEEEEFFTIVWDLFL